jgi:hypothetical protein
MAACTSHSRRSSASKTSGATGGGVVRRGGGVPRGVAGLTRGAAAAYSQAAKSSACEGLRGGHSLASSLAASSLSQPFQPMEAHSFSVVVEIDLEAVRPIRIGPNWLPWVA